MRNIEQNTIIGGQLLYNIVLASHTSTQISHTYTYVSSLLNIASHLPPHPISLKLSQNTGLGSLFHTGNSHLLSILHTVMYMFSCYSLNLSYSFLPQLCPQVCFLCLAGGFLATGPPGKPWTSLFWWEECQQICHLREKKKSCCSPHCKPEDRHTYIPTASSYIVAVKRKFQTLLPNPAWCYTPFFKLKFFSQPKKKFPPLPAHELLNRCWGLNSQSTNFGSAWEGKKNTEILSNCMGRFGIYIKETILLKNGNLRELSQ